MGNTTIPAELVAINAISGTLIADNAITSVHIAQNNITATQIATGAVSALQIAGSTITSAKIADGTIVTADIADGQITTGKLADSSVTTAKIADGTIIGGDIANNAILTQHIDDNQITADQIADNAVGIGQLAGIARGKIIVGDSAGNPALLALGAANTLLQSDGTDLVFAPLQSGIDDNSNAVAITIDSSEKVGIGTTSPVHELTIGASGADAKRSISIEGTNGSSEKATFELEADGENSIANFKFNTGNGTGTTRMVITSAGDILGKTADVRIGSDVGSVEYGTSTNNSVRFYSNNAERMRLSGAGAIEIKGSSTTTNAQAFITNSNSVLTIGSSVSGSVVKDISFNSPSTIMYIDGSASRVGIGVTTAPESLLHIKSADNVTAVLKIEGGKPTVTGVGEINAQLDFGSNDASVNNTGNIAGRIASVTSYSNGSSVDMTFSTFKQDDDPKLSEKMRVTDTGRVGIGEDGPADTLHVNKAGGAARIRIGSGNDAYYTQKGYLGDTWQFGSSETGDLVTSAITGGGFTASNAGGAFVWKTTNSGAFNEKMRLTSDGKVGIGTGTPQSNHAKANNLVVGSGAAGGMAVFNGTAEGWYAFSRANANNSDAYDGGMSYDGSRNLKFHTNAGATRMTILGNGRVGIGTIAPSANLDIAGGGSSTVPTLELTSATSTAFNHSINAFNPNLTDGEGNLIVVGRAGSTKNAGWLGYQYYSDGSDNNIISLGHWGNNWLLNVKGNGNVGIGTTAPATLLHLKAASGEAELRVEAAANSEARLRFGDATDNDAGYIGYSRANGLLSFSALNSRGVDMKIGSAGTVGINIAPTTGVQLYVDAPVNRHAGLFRNASANYAPIISDNLATSGTRFFVSFRLNNTEVGKITSTGSSTVYATSSDHRLKENIDYTWDATTRLKQLKPARFNWIADATNTLVDGFIAHEAATVVPESVTGEKDAVDVDNNPVMQGIDQSKLVPLLVKTIQELEARITILEG